MAHRSERLRVVVATPLAEQQCEMIERLEPRIDLIRDQSLYPPMRHPADFDGDPSFRRTSTQQQEFEDMVDSAEALYGIPDVDPDALRRTVDANPGLRWVHTMAAGGGGQVKAAGLSEDQLRRIVFTTSAGQARASTRACHSLILPSRSITTPTRCAPFCGSTLAP